MKVLSAQGEQAMADYTAVLENMLLHYEEKGEGIICLIFSRNRAIQLYALLNSYFKYVQHSCDVIIMYSADEGAQAASYQQLSELIAAKGWPVTMIREQHFRNDLIHQLEQLTQKHVFFLVDDILFIRPMDLNDWKDIDTTKYIPSIRLGKNIDYSYAHQQVQSMPVLEASGRDLYTWNWKDGEYDWGYPLSVDGNIFSRAELLSLIKSISFKAPNTLERELQRARPFFLQRKGITYGLPRIVNNPCNKVQVEIDNPSGNVSPEYLLQKWNDGFELDIDKYDDIKTNSVHQELELIFKKREQ
jgi:hypothetical protein